jgi:hypothetical protein
MHRDVVEALKAKALAWARSLPASPARDAAAANGKPVDKGKGRLQPRGKPGPPTPNGG